MEAMQHFALHGLVAAPFTPFREDGSLHLERIGALADHLVHNRIAGAFVCGTTGEGLSLTDAERRSVASAWVRAAAGRFKVIVHVGHLSGRASTELAAHAQEIGAAAVATCGPFFYPIRSVPEAISALQPIAAACPRLPFYFYHIPQFTHIEHLGMVDFLREGAGLMPNLRGVKYTHNDIEEYARLVDLDGGRFDVPFGRDQILLAGLTVGARGAIGSTFNFMPSLFHELFAAFERRDLAEARRLQTRAANVVRLMRSHGGLSAMKVTMRSIGLDCGPVRPPLRNLSSSEEAALLRALRENDAPIAA